MRERGKSLLDEFRFLFVYNYRCGGPRLDFCGASCVIVMGMGKHDYNKVGKLMSCAVNASWKREKLFGVPVSMRINPFSVPMRYAFAFPVFIVVIRSCIGFCITSPVGHYIVFRG